MVFVLMDSAQGGSSMTFAQIRSTPFQTLLAVAQSTSCDAEEVARLSFSRRRYRLWRQGRFLLHLEVSVLETQHDTVVLVFPDDLDVILPKKPTIWTCELYGGHRRRPGGFLAPRLESGSGTAVHDIADWGKFLDVVKDFE